PRPSQQLRPRAAFRERGRVDRPSAGVPQGLLEAGRGLGGAPRRRWQVGNSSAIFIGRTSRSMMVGIPAREQPQEKPMNDVVAPVRNGIDFKAEAHRDPRSVPLDEIDVSNPYLYSEDTWHGFFARLRRDDPVHFCDSPLYGPYWSVTRYRDIMTVDTSHQTYSSDAAFG